ncbi:MAG: tetratricopeptide repeat protein [Planctomycetes bacterium]|nr:tetratricopeptide repeat protein [Planctomycetota bacterium]
MSRSDSKKSRQLIERACGLIAQGEIDAAKDLLKDSIRSFEGAGDPDAVATYAELWYQLGRCHLAGRRADKAIQSFENALRTDPEHLEAKLRLVESKLDSGDALGHDMVGHYVLYLSKGPLEKARLGALRRLQQILRIRLNERPATVVWRVEMLEKLARLLPQLKFPRLYLGRGRYLQEDYAGAIRELEPLADKSPDSHHLLNMLARSYEKVGRLEDAHRSWEQSLRIVPGQAGVHFRIGRLELTFAQRSA